jgi:hypothetical protein
VLGFYFRSHDRASSVGTAELIKVVVFKVKRAAPFNMEEQLLWEELFRLRTLASLQATDSSLKVYDGWIVDFDLHCFLRLFGGGRGLQAGLNGDVLWSFDPKPYAISAYFKDGDFNVVRNNDLLVFLATDD